MDKRNQRRGSFVSLLVRTGRRSVYPLPADGDETAARSQTFAIGAIDEIIDARRDDRFDCGLPAILVREGYGDFTNKGPQTPYFVSGSTYEELVALIAGDGEEEKRKKGGAL